MSLIESAYMSAVIFAPDGPYSYLNCKFFLFMLFCRLPHVTRTEMQHRFPQAISLYFQPPERFMLRAEKTTCRTFVQINVHRH